jgi:hypothetical protein
LKPSKKLNLPEHSLVEVKVSSMRAVNKKTEFASLIGIWDEANDLNLEKSLASIRRKSKTKIKKLAKALK